MEPVVQKTCIICGESKDQGITIVTEFICTSCESELVRTHPDDDKYPFFVRQLKPIWIRYDI